MKRSREEDTSGGRTSERRFGSDSARRPSNAISRSRQCFRPVQKKSAVALDFNFWATHGCISSADISRLIRSVLARNSPSCHTSKTLCAPFLDLEEKRVDHLYVFALHSIDAGILERELPSLPFLQSCSSAPVRHTLAPTATPTFNDENSYQKGWPFSSVDYMTSSIFWPEMDPLPLASYVGMDVVRLFESKKLLCRGVHAQWNAALVFVADSSVAGDYHALIDKYMLKDPGPTPHAAALRYTAGADACVGRFQKQGNSDTGLFHISRAATGAVLVLAWDRWDPETLVCANDSLPFEFTTIPSMFSVYLDAVFPRPSEALDGMRSQTSVRTQLSREGMLLLVRDMYANPRAKAALSALCLSSDLQLLMGYDAERRMYVYDRDGVCINQSHEYLTTTAPNLSRAAVTGTAMSTVEDGEEEEEVEAVSDPAGSAPDASAALEVCAIDCEMCVTAAGLELTRISMVCPMRGIVLDTFVKPARPITNYNTEFSGITEATLLNVTTSLKDVHSLLKTLLNADTIIVGHGLENDLRALRLNHARVIDTAALYPHTSGLPLKNSLKKLAEEVLRRTIRENEVGHCSVEDACLALELALVKASVAPGVPRPCVGAETPRESLMDLVRRDACAEAVSRVSLHGSSLLSHRGDWEREGLSYRPEADVVNAVDLSAGAVLNTRCEVKCGRYADCYTAFEEALQAMKAHDPSDLATSFTWVDMPCGSYRRLVSGGEDLETKSGWLSLDTIDACIGDAFKCMPLHSLLVVLTQGDVQELKALMAKKQLHRWEPSRHWYDDADETKLIAAAANCLCGAAFLNHK